MEEQIKEMLGTRQAEVFDGLPEPAREYMLREVAKEPDYARQLAAEDWMAHFASVNAEFEAPRKAGENPDFRDYVAEMLGPKAGEKAAQLLANRESGNHRAMVGIMERFAAEPRSSYDSLAAYQEIAAKEYGVKGWLEDRLEGDSLSVYSSVYDAMPEETREELDANVSYRAGYDGRVELNHALRDTIAQISGLRAAMAADAQGEAAEDGQRAAFHR